MLIQHLRKFSVVVILSLFYLLQSSATCAYAIYPIHQYKNIGKFTAALTVSGYNGTDTEMKTDFIRIEDSIGLAQG